MSVSNAISLHRLPFTALTLATGLAGMALAATPLARQWGLGTLALSLLIGLLVAQPLPADWRRQGAPALALFKGPVLKAAIVLYGLRIPLQAVGELGIGVILLDAAQILISLGLALWLGRRLLGMSQPAALLIGAGNGICGAAAVLAAEPVLGGKNRDTAMAVAAVVVFGTLNMLLLPLAYHQWPDLLGDPQRFALFTGATVQEVAQVIVAAQAMSPALVDTALLVKMIRVMMLAPTLLLLVALVNRQHRQRPGAEAPARPGGGVRMPPFALLFVAALVVNGVGLVPDALAPHIAALDDILLALAMAALGLSTHVDLLRQAGWRPLALGALLWAVTLLVGALALAFLPI